MLDTSGRYRMRYADVFRALGQYLDTARFRDLTLVETPDGFFIAGLVLDTDDRGSQLLEHTLLFTNADIEIVLEQGFARRGQPLAPETQLASVTIGAEAIRYEDALRALGTFIDEHHWQHVAAVQTATDLLLKGMHNGESISVVVNGPALHAMLANRFEQRQAPLTQPKRRLWSRS